MEVACFVFLHDYHLLCQRRIAMFRSSISIQFLIILNPVALYNCTSCYAKIRSSSTRAHIHSLRGGVVDPTRSLWSTSNSKSSSSKPASFKKVTVTDVTDEIRNVERETTKEVIDSFLTRESRNSFIVRVYAILTGQLSLVGLSVLLFGRFPSLSRWMLFKGRVIPMISLLVSTVTLTIFSSSERARRASPVKWQLLSLFSIAEAIVIGFITSFYKTKTVLSATMSTAVATFAITMYTVLNHNPKRDLSQLGASISSMGMIFIFYGFIHLLSSFGILPMGFLPYNEILYSIFGTSLFSLYLAYHTSLIVSGKHSKYQLNDKDYVFGAVLLYNDIINIFLYLLRLLDDDR
jgi:protein lifeguard